MSLSILVCWMVVIFILTICRVRIACRSGKKKQLNLQDILKISTSAYVILSGIKLVYKVVTSQDLMKLLGDDTTTLFIGAFVLMWLSIKDSLPPST